MRIGKHRSYVFDFNRAMSQIAQQGNESTQMIGFVSANVNRCRKTLIRSQSRMGVLELLLESLVPLSTARRNR